MVRQCNNVGISIYVDVVLNHMAGADRGKGAGLTGTSFDADTFSFPGVPYSNLDFNSKTSYPSACNSRTGNIENYNDPNQVRNCRLMGLLDVNQGKSYVRDKIVEFLNKLIRIGVAGFRIDAAKHMWPGDMEPIFKRLDNLNTEYFPAGSRPFIFQEVIDFGSDAIRASEYFSLGRVTEFRYGAYVTKAFRGLTPLKFLKNFGANWGNMMPEANALVFIDNQDTQRGNLPEAGNLATFWEPRLYKMATSYMLAWPYGITRVMSSYGWPRSLVNGKDKNDWYGPPHDDNYNTQYVLVNRDETCGNGWVCEHRWRQIYNMAKFRNVAGSEKIANWWDDDGNQIAFSRGSKAFCTINASTWKNMDATVQTGLPEGRYCDIISGNISPDQKSCSGITISVGADGKARIIISAKAEDPMIALHVEAKLS